LRRRAKLTVLTLAAITLKIGCGDWPGLNNDGKLTDKQLPGVLRAVGDPMQIAVAAMAIAAGQF